MGNGGFAIPRSSENGFGSVVGAWINTDGDPDKQACSNVGCIKVNIIWERIVVVFGLSLSS